MDGSTVSQNLETNKCMYSGRYNSSFWYHEYNILMMCISCVLIAFVLLLLLLK